MNSADLKRVSDRLLHSRSFRRGGLFLLITVLLSSSLYLLTSPGDEESAPKRAQVEPPTKVVQGPSVEPPPQTPLEAKSETQKVQTASRPAAKPKVTKSKVVVAKIVKPPEKEEVVAVSDEAPAEPVESAAAAPIIESAEEEPAKGGYIKISAAGERLPDSAEKWACVEDTATGLVWEVKSAERGLHHKGNLYSWYQPDASSKAIGVADGGRCAGKIDCDSHAFTQALNIKNYCGYADWRVPTLDEMVTILEHGANGTEVSINRDYFPEGLRSWYWTATPHERHPEYAWYLLFRNGIALSDRKTRSKHIRLVRSDTPV